MATLPLITRIAFRFAMSSARHAAVRQAIGTAGTLAGLLLAFGIVGTLDYQEELRQEAESARAQSDFHQAALLACINGGAPGLYTMTSDGGRVYLVCGKPFEVNDGGLRK